MNAPDFSLCKQTALVTGASRGLGFAIAQAYAARGARVIINGRSADAVHQAVERLRQQGHAAFPMVLDIARLHQQEQALAEACALAGPPSILVNNVGIRMRKGLDDFCIDEVVELIHTNLTAAITLSRLAAQSMVARQQSGRIITLTSIAGPLARPGDAVYPIAKQGLSGLVRALAVEYGGHGVTSNGIAPGTFATETNQAYSNDPATSTAIIGRNPLGRWAQPHEITGPAVFLASPAASYVNGHILVVDGGYSITY